MRTIALPVLVTAALAAGAPAASAGSDSTLVGGCGFTATDNQADGQMTGEIHVAAVAWSRAQGAGPAPATVTCSITVNGAAQPGAVVVASGTAAIVGAGPAAYASSSPADDVRLCERVDYTGPGDTTPTSETCAGSATPQFPPQTLPDDWWDPLVCEHALAPAAGSYGAVVVNDQGDIYVNGEPQWDCPPYDIEWGS